MSVYGSATSMATLLKAMRDGAKQDTTVLTYLRAVAIAYPPLIAFTAEPALFIVPNGSPEREVAERRIYRAIHTVTLYALVYTASPEKETVLLGNNKEVGLLQFVDDIMAFYNNNTLSLSGLEANLGPRVTVPEESYTIEETDDGKHAVVARIVYEATTKPFTK